MLPFVVNKLPACTHVTKLLSFEYSTKQSFALTNLLSSLPCSAEFQGRAVIRKLISATPMTDTQSSRRVLPRPECVHVRTKETSRWESWTLSREKTQRVRFRHAELNMRALLAEKGFLSTKNALPSSENATTRSTHHGGNVRYNCRFAHRRKCRVQSANSLSF